MAHGLDFFNSPAGLMLEAGNYTPFLEPKASRSQEGTEQELFQHAMVAAIALRELGYRTADDWAGLSGASDNPNVSAMLAVLEDMPLDDLSRARVRIEASRILERQMAYEVLSELEATLPQDQPGSKALTAQFRLARGIVGVNARKFETAVADFQFAIDEFQEADDARCVAETQFQFGRFRAWQGREDLALPLLEESLNYWVDRGNHVMSAHVRYELGSLWVDRRKFDQAMDQFEIVIKDYESVSIAPSELARARQRSADALIALGRLDEADVLLLDLLSKTPEGDTFRRQMILKNQGEVALQRAKDSDPEQLADHIKTAAERVTEAMALFEGEPPRDKFEGLILRGLQGEIIAFNPAASESLRLAGVDAIVRSAVGFSLAPQERPHEVRLRINAIAAYLHLTETASDDVSNDLRRAITFQVEQLNMAAAKIGANLADPAAKRVLLEAERVASISQDELSCNIKTDMTLMDVIGQDTSLDFKLELMARLVEALQDQYQLGIEPTAFRPSEVMVKAGGYPIIRPHTSEVSGRRVSTSDRAFMSPEFIAGREIVAQSDYYVVGALLLEWMNTKLPVNAGPRFWLRLHRMLTSRGRLGKSQPKATSKLVAELVYVNAEDRPGETFSISARLRSGAED